MRCKICTNDKTDEENFKTHGRSYEKSSIPARIRGTFLHRYSPCLHPCCWCTPTDSPVAAQVKNGSSTAQGCNKGSIVSLIGIESRLLAHRGGAVPEYKEIVPDRYGG